MSSTTLTWIVAIMFIIFYVRFIIESANEIELLNEGMQDYGRSSGDKTAKIRANMEKLERDNERIERLTKSASRASDISQKWSPMNIIWHLISFF